MPNKTIANDFFSFELDVRVPADSIKIGHSVNANVFRMTELASVAGKPSGELYTVGEIRRAFMSRWNLPAETPAFLRVNGGEAVEAADVTEVPLGAEVEFRAKDGEKGGLMDFSFIEVRKLAKKIGLPTRGKKSALVAAVIDATLPEVAAADGSVTLPLDKAAAATVTVLRAQYKKSRKVVASADGISVRDLFNQYADCVLEKGKVVRYSDVPNKKTSFISSETSSRFVGRMVSDIVEEFGEVISASLPAEDVLQAGQRLTIILK